MIVPNDLEPKATRHTEVNRELLFKREPAKYIRRRVLSAAWRRAVSHSYACKYVQYCSKLRTVRAKQKTAKPRSPQWQDARSALDGIIALCRNENVDLVPCLYGTSETVKTTSALNLYREHLEGIGVRPFPILTEQLSKRRYRNSLVDGHANADGHALIARTLYEYLEPIVKKRLRSIDTKPQANAMPNQSMRRQSIAAQRPLR